MEDSKTRIRVKDKIRSAHPHCNAAFSRRKKKKKKTCGKVSVRNVAEKE